MIRPNDPLSFNVNASLELYVAGEYDGLSDEFLTRLEYFRDHLVARLDPSLRLAINSFVKTFLFLFTQPRYQISPQYAVPFLSLNRTVSNLVAISSAGTTDAFLELLRDQPVDLVKTLTLHSARNRVKLDRSALFDANPELASLWYSAYASLVSTGVLNATVHENLKEHFLFHHPALRVNFHYEQLYFGATYFDPEQDRLLKQQINSQVQQYLGRLPAVRNRPARGKIGLVSANWSPAHSVYRNYSAYVEALKERHYLAFYQLGRSGPADTGLFDEVHVLDSREDLSDLSVLLDNDLEVIYYPDVGMSDYSILLANLRLAPIQVCSPGHSVSTWGSKIDYFISGADVEPPDAAANYSERLVLLPGMGVVHNRPEYRPRGRAGSSGAIVVNCPWTCAKLNHRFLRTLKRILHRAERSVRFRLFTARTTYVDNGHIPFVRNLCSELGAKHVEVLHGLAYADYMAAMEHGDLTIDSFHFGGCNTIADSLLLGIPTVTWEGNQWYNRIGSQMLRLVGLAECIARNEHQYCDLVVRLIQDEAYRDRIRQTLREADLEQTIYSRSAAKYFARAIDYLVAHHDELQADSDRSPIRIPE